MHGLAGILVDGGVTRIEDAPLTPAWEGRLPELGRLAFRVAYGVLRQRQDAEDVAQEALVRACRKQATLRDAAQLRAWLVRIAWRTAIDRQRSDRRRARRELLALPGDPEATTEDVAARSEFHERLWRAIDRLPDALRLVTVLAAIEGHTTSEVAALLELPEGTVKSRLFQARRQLAEALR